MTAAAPIAWVDTGLVPLAEARVSVLDQGFRTGEGVFETLRAYDGHPFRLGAHLDRAADGARRLGFALPERYQVERAVQATIDANRGLARDLAVRVTVTPGPLDPSTPWPPVSTGHPTLVVTAHALHDRPHDHDGVTAVTVGWGREVAEVKAVSYLASTLARRAAAQAGADEALLTDGRGNVVEGATSNVFAITGDRLRTPPTDGGLLAGVTRATVLELGPGAGLLVEEAPLTAATLQGADEAFLTASTREVVPLVRVDGTAVGDGRPGPVTARLQAAYRTAVERERDREH